MTSRRPQLGIAPAPGDQILRLNAYEAAHPAVRITYDHVYGYWRAIVPGAHGTEITAVRYTLGELLDRLYLLDELDDG